MPEARQIAAAMVALGGGISAAAAAVAIASRIRADPSNILTTSQFPFDEVLRDPAYDEWFRANLRCSQQSFRCLLAWFEERDGKSTPAHVTHSRAKKIAVLLYYLGSQGGYREAAHAFGMCKSWAIESTAKLLDTLNDAAATVLTWPNSLEAWDAVEESFRAKRGFPGVVGAIDGCLIARQRPRDYEGMYCRKGFPAVNAQAIVDSNCRVMSLEIRPGSWSDQKTWRKSAIGRSISAKLPPGRHLVGDGGYALSPYLMTPFQPPRNSPLLPRSQRRYNFALSSTRMAVERTFGLIKGRFRTLKRVLEEKTAEKLTKVIVASFVLHNLFLDFADDTMFDSLEDQEDHDEVSSSNTTAQFLTDKVLRDIALCKRNDILALFESHIQ